MNFSKRDQSALNRQSSRVGKSGIPDYETLARELLDVCIRVSPGDRVWINSWEYDAELASILAWQCLKRSCHVLTSVQHQDYWMHSIMEGAIELVDNLSPHQAAALEETNVYIFTVGPRLIPWTKIPTERRHLVTRWFSEKNRFVSQWKKIASEKKVKMLGIEATLANPDRAKMLGVDYDEWRKVMFDGCIADHNKMEIVAKSLGEVLGGYGQVRLATPHGTDLRFNLDSRPVDSFGGIVRDDWIAIGRPAFLPAGGIEVSVAEESGYGKVVFDQPILSLLDEGRLEELKLTVEAGRIIDFTSSIHQEAFGKWLREGKGDCDRLGFFGLGLNPRLRQGFTQDDKVLGGVTIGFGDNSDKMGHNRADRGFWASMTGATVTIDDKVIMKNGLLLVN